MGELKLQARTNNHVEDSGASDLELQAPGQLEVLEMWPVYRAKVYLGYSRLGLSAELQMVLAEQVLGVL